MRISAITLILFLVTPALFAADGCVSYNYCENWTGKCETGDFQSPIANNARDRKGVDGLPYLARYNESAAVSVKVNNTGTTLKATPARRVVVKYGEEPLVLQEFHFHTPAEHKLDVWLSPCEKFAVAELHLVHLNAANKIVVVAVPIYVGNSNPALAALMAGGKITRCESRDRSLSPQALSSLLPPSTARYITYEGSLTTPGCDEGVTFLLMGGISATEAELEYIKVVYNARPVQRNAKPVYFRVAKPGE